MITINIAASLVCAYRSCFYFKKLQKYIFKFIEINTELGFVCENDRTEPGVLVLQWILQPWPPVLPEVSIKRVCWFKQPTYSHTNGHQCPLFSYGDHFLDVQQQSLCRTLKWRPAWWCVCPANSNPIICSISPTGKFLLRGILAVYSL